MKLAFEADTMPATSEAVDVIFLRPSKKPYTPLDEWAEMLYKYGYDALSAYYAFFKWMKYKGTYKQETKKLTETLDSLGMTFSSISNCVLKCSPQPWVRDDGVKSVCESLDVARDIDANTVVAHAGVNWFNYYSEEENWEVAVDMWKRICKHAEEVGVDVSIEPVGFMIHEVVRTPTQTLKMIEDVGSERLKVTWDTAQMQIGCMGDLSVREGIKALGKYINELHIKDVTGASAMGPLRASTWLGYGVVNFKETFKALKEAGYNGYGSVEISIWTQPHYPHRLMDLERGAEEAAKFVKANGWY